jgi:transcriptional regulator with XRE-family HTH domain
MARRSATRNDQLIGLNIKARRTVLKITQAAVAAHLGVFPQRYGLYERGGVRIPASLLVEIAQFLENTPIAYFFSGIDVDGPTGTATESWELRNLTATTHGRKLLAALRTLREPEMTALTHFIEAMAEPRGGRN